MKKSSPTLIIGFVASVIGITSAQLTAHAQLTVQRPGNVVGSGSNAWSYLVMEGESYVADQDANPASGFGKVYNDAALADFYGNPILPATSTASMQGALGTLGPLFGRFTDKVTYQVVFSTPGDYYMYMRFSMFENGSNPAGYTSEDSFFFPPDFNKDPQFDWPIPGNSGADDGGYTEGCCGSKGFLFILDYQGDGSRTDHSSSANTNYWEGNFHWNQLFVSQFLSGIHTNQDGSTRAGSPFHYVVTPQMVGVPQDFTIAYREQGVTVDLFLFSTYTNLLNDYTQDQLDQLLVSKVAVQDSGNVEPAGSNSWSYLVMEGENFAAKSNRNLTTGFTAVAPGSTNNSAYATPILATNTTASGKGALGTMGPLFGRFTDKINYQVQFSRPGDYYMYMRFTMFENGSNLGGYTSEDSFFFPPDFNKDPELDWPIPGTSGADDGGYTEGCCGSKGFLFILDYHGDGSRTDHSSSANTNYWEGNFHWNQLFVSQFLSGIHTNQDGSTRAGSAFHYVVTPAMVGIPQNFTIAYREQGVTPDLFLFSTYTNLLNDYTQEQLDQLILQPKLAINRDSTNAVVSWSRSASGYRLESSTSLAAPNWTPVLDSAAIVGNSYNVTVTPTGTRYYRLRQR